MNIIRFFFSFLAELKKVGRQGSNGEQGVTNVAPMDTHVSADASTGSPMKEELLKEEFCCIQ